MYGRLNIRNIEYIAASTICIGMKMEIDFLCMSQLIIDIFITYSHSIKLHVPKDFLFYLKYFKHYEEELRAKKFAYFQFSSQCGIWYSKELNYCHITSTLLLHLLFSREILGSVLFEIVL